jgi:hypothetical protein
VEENHLQCGDYIFVAWETSVIEGWNIGYVMTTQVPTWLDLSFSEIGDADFQSNVFGWCDPVLCNEYPNPEIYMTVSVQDQIGMDCYPGAGGYDFTVTIESGTGQVWSSDSGYSSSSVTQNVVGDYKYAFKYRRIEDSTEYLPTIRFDLASVPPLSRTTALYLVISGEALAPAP